MILINSSPRNALGIFQPFLPITPPIGLGFLAAAAERESVPVTIIDEQIERDVLGLIAKTVPSEPQPLFFGFSVLTASLDQAVILSAEVKKRYPGSTICFGGAHPTAMPDEILSFPHIDYVIRGEAEKPLVDLYRALQEHRDVRDIENLAYCRDGQVCINPISYVVADMDAMPGFPYERFLGQPYDIGIVLSSRGCPYKCIFCSNQIATGKRYRFRNPVSVVDDLEFVYRTAGVTDVGFFDDNFLVNRHRVLEILAEIRKRDLHESMTFSFQARGDNVDRELLKELYESGFHHVFFGLETASNRLLQVLDKGETVEQCIQAVRWAKELNYRVSGTFIYAIPGETHRDRMDTLRLSKDLKLDMVRYNNATPYPGTPLYRMAKKDNGLVVQGRYTNFISVSTFIENPFRKIPFSYVPPGSTEKEIRYDILASYLAFYLNFRRLKGTFAGQKNGPRWFHVGETVKTFLRKVPSLAYIGLIMTIKYADMFFAILFRRGVPLTTGELLSIVFRPQKHPPKSGPTSSDTPRDGT